MRGMRYNRLLSLFSIRFSMMEVVVNKLQDFETKEEVSDEIEIEVPDCFSYFDREDPSCNRCPVRFHCIEEQRDNLPPCFGNVELREGNPGCGVCILESQCVDTIDTEDNSKMARRRVKRVTVRKRPKPEPKPEPVEEVIPEDAGLDYSSWSVSELKDELDERDLDTGGRKSVLVKRLLADDAGEEPEEEPEEEEAPEPKPKSRRRRVKKAKPEVVPEPEPEADAVFGLDDILLAMQNGQAFVVTRVAECEWQFAPSGEVVAASTGRGRGLKGAEFEKEAYSEDFYKFFYEDASGGKAWKAMTSEERYAMADEVGASWTEHENSKTDAMRMGQAVRESLEISKWKPEYESRSARRALKGM